MANTIDSDKIKVFPCVRRPDYWKDSRELTETNIATIVGKSMGDFVVDDLSDNKVRFFLDGYYVEIDLSSFSGATNPYLYMQFAYSDDADGYKTISSVDITKVSADAMNLDYNGKFYGLQYRGGNTDTDTGKGLCVLHKNNGSWEVPEKSKFSYKILQSDDIVDGGII